LIGLLEAVGDALFLRPRSGLGDALLGFSDEVADDMLMRPRSGLIRGC
jgi:hypothetical protein